jgi:hypothetical protein
MHFYSLDDLGRGFASKSHNLYSMRRGSIGYEIGGAGDYRPGFACACAGKD